MSIDAEPHFSNSDHVSILCHLTSHFKTGSDNVLKPCFKKADYSMINAFLININWCEVYKDCVTANDYWVAFRNIINTAIFNFVPFVNVKCKRTPWFHKL